MITENLSTLKIHKLTQTQYDRELEAGNIDANALYLTPDEEADLSGYATVEYVDTKAEQITSSIPTSLKNPNALTINGQGYDGSEAVTVNISDGEDGQTPYIGDNNNWWIGDTDTGVNAAGEDGLSVYSVELDKSQSDDTQSVYFMTNEGDVTIGSFTVYHGKDYVLTDDDKTEIASLVPNVTTPEAPTFANGVAEMTDASKVYVNLETGTFWRYQEATVTKEVTVTDAIEATDDNPYHDSSRLSSSTTDDTFSADARGYHVTPLIDLTKPEYVGKTIQVHLEGAQYAFTGAYAQWIQCRGYSTNKAILMPRPYTCDSASVGNSIVSITSGISVTYNSDTSAVLTITILPTYSFSDPTEIGYIRFCGKGAVADSNIYITYTNTEAVTETTWVDTGMTYTSAISEEEKQQIADDIIARIDTELLSVVGSGEVV